MLLVIAYRELRLLENELIDKLFSKGGQSKGLLDIGTLSRITVDQFYGLEIDASAAHIAQVAGGSPDHQLNLITAERFGNTPPQHPLGQKRPHLPVQRPAHRLGQRAAAEQCSFIVGNPPFVGAKCQNDEQRADGAQVMGAIPNAGLLDYVCCWHVKAAAYRPMPP